MRNDAKNVTESKDLTVLAFVGGPFDGFEESIMPDEDLPGCIALPMNETAERIFGIQFCKTSPRVAVYLLSDVNGSPAYHFHGMRLA